MSSFNALNHLNALRAFESVLRLGSVKAAADELCVSDGAVSRQLSQLEASIGHPLFTRVHRGLSPTPLGLSFGDDIRVGFQRLLAANDKVNMAQEQNQLSIAAPSTFLSRWLIPRQASVQRAIGDTPALYMTYHGPPSMAPTDVHIFIAIGTVTRDSTLQYREFMPQDLCLVVQAQRYEEIRHDPRWPSKLNRFTPASFPGLWAVWKDQVSSSAPDFDGPEIRLERMHYAIEAVEAGQGYTIVPRGLVQESIKQKRLVAPFEAEQNSEYYCFHIPKKYDANPVVQKMARWLLREGALNSRNP